MLTVFAATHLAAYKRSLPRFEREHGIVVTTQLTDWRALESRLQSAILSGADIPDVIELAEGSLGFFTRGKPEEIGFVDLTERIQRDGYRGRVVESRFSPWSAHGRIYALPHDVHPVTLVYRRDLIERLGIDVNALETWDDFVAMGRRVTRDLDGDGTLDRFALDLPVEGAQGLSMLLLQRGARYFDAQGQVAFDSEETAQTMAWYVRQLHGPHRIAFDAGFGQTTGKALSDGLVLFFFCPDWRSRVFEREVPRMRGKMGMIPLPAWSQGGRRTSVWGGTGVVISRRSEKVDLAWDLAKFLYFDPQGLAERFRETNIIPPLEDVWSSRVFDEPNPYYSGQRIGRLYANLAPEVPPVYSAATYRATYLEVDAVLAKATLHYQKFGENGLLKTIRADLAEAEAYAKRLTSRSQRIAEGS